MSGQEAAEKLAAQIAGAPDKVADFVNKLAGSGDDSKAAQK